jgi:hypothetical protein
MLLRAGIYFGMAGRCLGDDSYAERWLGHAEDLTEEDYVRATSEIRERLLAGGYIKPDEDPATPFLCC